MDIKDKRYAQKTRQRNYDRYYVYQQKRVNEL